MLSVIVVNRRMLWLAVVQATWASLQPRGAWRSCEPAWLRPTDCIPTFSCSSAALWLVESSNRRGTSKTRLFSVFAVCRYSSVGTSKWLIGCYIYYTASLSRFTSWHINCLYMFCQTISSIQLLTLDCYQAYEMFNKNSIIYCLKVYCHRMILGDVTKFKREFSCYTSLCSISGTKKFQSFLSIITNHLSKYHSCFLFVIVVLLLLLSLSLIALVSYCILP